MQRADGDGRVGAARRADGGLQDTGAGGPSASRQGRAPQSWRALPCPRRATACAREARVVPRPLICLAVLALLLGHPCTSANFLCVNGETSCYSIPGGHARLACFLLPVRECGLHTGRLHQPGRGWPHLPDGYRKGWLAEASGLSVPWGLAAHLASLARCTRPG